MMEEDMKAILYTQEEVAARIQSMGEQLTRDYQGELPLVVGDLRCSFFLWVYLESLILIPLELDFVVASSYVLLCPPPMGFREGTSTCTRNTFC